MASQQGFCEAILLHLDSIAGMNYPAKKVTPVGFTQMLLDQPIAYTPIQEGFSGGQTRAVNIKYPTRGTISQVSTTDTCAVDVQPLFKETSATVDNFVSVGIWIPDSQMRQYCEDATRTVAVGAPPTQLMAQVLDFVLLQMNSLYQKQESVLTTAMASTFGKHKATGSANAVAVNIEQDGNLNDLTAGVLKMLVDARANEFCGTPRFVGALGGLMDAYDMQYRMRGLSAGVGLDNRALLDNAAFKFYASGLAGTTWGATNVGMFSEDSAHYLEYLQNVGAWAGTRGNSTFSTIIDPRMQCWAEGNTLGNVRWDMQVRYADCPEDVANFITSGYKNVNTISGRGYLVRIYKYYDLFVTPTDAYDGADVLAGSNGTLRYSLTNT
jgi:hypothetical protein